MKNLINTIKWRTLFFFKEDLKPWRLKARFTQCWRGKHVMSHYIGKRSLHFIATCLICHKKWTGPQLEKWIKKNQQAMLVE